MLAPCRVRRSLGDLGRGSGSLHSSPLWRSPPLADKQSPTAPKTGTTRPAKAVWRGAVLSADELARRVGAVRRAVRRGVARHPTTIVKQTRRPAAASSIRMTYGRPTRSRAALPTPCTVAPIRATRAWEPATATLGVASRRPRVASATILLRVGSPVVWEIFYSVAARPRPTIVGATISAAPKVKSRFRIAPSTSPSAAPPTNGW
jgi:hypothetical protein